MGKAQAPTPESGSCGLQPHQVLLRPLVTEKGVHRSVRNNQYAFEIHRDANKFDVRQAVEALFNVKVEKVCTQTRKGKTRRYRFRLGHTPRLEEGGGAFAPDNKIEFF